MRPSSVCAISSILTLGAAEVVNAQSVTIPDSLPPGVTAEMVTLGETVFTVDGKCTNCHGSDATGEFGPNLTDGEWLHAKGDYSTILEQIRVGVPADRSFGGSEMPPGGGSDLSEAELRAVGAYVWRTAHPSVRDSLPLGVTAEMVRRGRRVFNRRGQCVRCHGADAGGAEGPNLTDDEWIHAKGSYLGILQRILLGVPAVTSVSGVTMRPRGGYDISYQQVHAVAAYVWVLSRQTR